MAQKRSQNETKSAEPSAAETVIDGQLAGKGWAAKLRRVSPVTAGLICAVMVALGLSVWPYIAPLLLPKPADPWQKAVDTELRQLRADMTALSENQTRLSDQLDTLQAGQGQLDKKMAGVVQSVSQSLDTVAAAIDRFDQQIAHIDEKLAQTAGQHSDAAAAQPADASDTAAQPAVRGAPAAADSPPASAQGKEPESNLPDINLPDVGLPDLSGWWQGLSGWLGGLITVDRLQREQEPQ